MEAFSLLKYWKSAAGSGGPPLISLPSSHNSSSSSSAATTIISAVTQNSDHDSDAEDGPFFDLEFAVPSEDDDINNNNNNDVNNEDDDDVVDCNEEDETEERENEIDDENEVEVVEERELEPNLNISPSDDLFFKGRILRIDGSEEEEMMNSGNKSGQFPIPVSLAKSATKFRVFFLGLKRSKSESKQCHSQNQPNNDNNNNNHQNKKFFTVKFKVEEVPIFSLLTRASSNSKVNSTTTPAAAVASSAAVKGGANAEEEEKEEHQKSDGSASHTEGSGDEKKNKKEVVQKYLKMVKIKVSKKAAERETTTVEKRREKVSQKQGLNLKVIAKKHLGKSKSAVVHSMVQNTTSSKKRDDSLLQQQDGIQSAILHCKRSFNSSTDFFDGVEASSVLLNTTDVAAAAVEEGNGGVAV